MKKTIYKYIFYEFLRYFATSLFTLAAIVWTVQAVNFLDLVTDDGHSFSIYFMYSILTSSKVLTKLIPFCFLIAIVLTIIKLEKDNELIALWTAGLNKIFIVNHIILISLIIMFLQLLLTVSLNPTLLNLSRSLLKNSELQFVSAMFKKKVFNDSVKGLTIFIEEKTDKNTYKNIFIRDQNRILSTVGTKSSTIIAKSGYMSDDEKVLFLFNGTIQKVSDNGNINIIKFEKTSFNIAKVSTKSISQPKMQETSTILILRCLAGINIVSHNCTTSKRTEMDTKIEINKRIGMPLFIPLIALVCSFLLTSQRNKKINYFNTYFYPITSVLILAAAEISVRYSGASWNHTYIYYLFPIGMLPLVYYALIRKFKYENLQ